MTYLSSSMTCTSHIRKLGVSSLPKIKEGESTLVYKRDTCFRLWTRYKRTNWKKKKRLCYITIKISFDTTSTDPLSDLKPLLNLFHNTDSLVNLFISVRVVENSFPLCISYYYMANQEDFWFGRHIPYVTKDSLVTCN